MFKCGQQFRVLAGAVVLCFGGDDSFLVWQELWFYFLAEVAVVLCFGEGGSFMFLQGEFWGFGGKSSFVFRQGQQFWLWRTQWLHVLAGTQVLGFSWGSGFVLWRGQGFWVWQGQWSF